ncbi:MAG: right-handed parallel beta-helix repeat-containing protein [Archaeoglobus sp.]|nr:right-handed parallel beta-helix repeat-containing protein [Archaeoglobus sp.]
MRLGKKIKICLVLIALLSVLAPVSAEVEHISSCTILEKPGYYVLDTDITINKTKCIEIKSSDVVLEGDGRKIKAGRFGGTYAIYVYHEAGLGNITIKNLILENWVYGVSLRDVAKVSIESVTTEGGFFGIYSSSVADLTLKNCKVSNPKKTAFGLEGVKKAELLNLEAVNAAENGLLISNSADISVHDSVFEKNGNGMYVKDSVNVAIDKCRSSYNEKFGLYIYSSEKVNISGFEAIGNKFDGIKAYSSSSCKIYSGNFDGNRNAIFLENSEDFRVIDNRILNSETGIFVSNSKNNHFTSNYLSNNGKGIVSTSSSYNLFNSNRIIGGEAITFHESSSSTITDNWIENAKKGISLIASNRNLIYLNNLFAEKNAFDDGDGNIWYSPKLKKGNFYSDYTGKDAYGDGIGDEDYLIPPKNVKDIYPLMKPTGEKPPVIEKEKAPQETPESPKETPTTTPEEIKETLIDFGSIEFVLGLVALVVIALLIALLKRDRIL